MSKKCKFSCKKLMLYSSTLGRIARQYKLETHIFNGWFLIFHSLLLIGRLKGQSPVRSFTYRNSYFMNIFLRFIFAKNKFEAGQNLSSQDCNIYFSTPYFKMAPN